MSEPDLVTQRGIRVPGAAISWTATRSGGPGGQHANTTDSRVTVTLDVELAGLPEALCTRLRAAHGPQIRATVDRSRSQFRNRQLARQRLAALIDEAATPPRTRRPTRPGRGAERRRLEAKRRQSERKRRRSWRPGDDG